jgi:hypothetical protein
MRAAWLLSALGLALAVGCTVDALVGSNALGDAGTDGGSDAGTDAGTPICPGTGPDCQPVCGAQICNAGCTGLEECAISCSGTSCSFSCERNAQACNPTCDPGPCRMDCFPAGEGISCTMTCTPPQTCAADCHNGSCTVACGDLEPATTCDAGVYSCSGTCPP